MDKKIIGLFQILLMVMSSFAFAYLVGESNSYFDNTVNGGENYGNEENYYGKERDMGLVLGGIKNFISLWMERSRIGVVSAQSEGLWTCPENLEGSVCQEYDSTICNDNCNVACFPGRRKDFSECKLGTCFDPSEGTCSANTPRATCENAEGDWTSAEAGIPPRCNSGCCLLGGQAQYITERACNVVSSRVGVKLDGVINRFDPTVSNELECLILAASQEEGACVLNQLEDEKFNCRFLSQSECLSSGGDFSAGLLCSNPELNTICLKQESVNCIDGEDEVYWYDSCGNRENIYDSNRVASWNNGRVLGKAESCSIERGNDRVGNQERCGNCNYLRGSICGSPGSGDGKIVDSAFGNFICKDLSCVDSAGADRKNGESWCEFDSRIGVVNDGQANLERSVDVPGSGQYRQVCLDGEVRTEACADYRNEVCVEQRDAGAGFSSAACRLNQWQLCIEANTDKAKLDRCEEHTDCTLHRTAIDDFAFDVCTPKHPAGFDLNARFGGEVGENICSVASQSCTYIEVKKLSGWKCEVNCDCKDSGFTEAMNNLCISLGDCGASVNVVGDYTDDGAKLGGRARPVSSGYVSGLKAYATPIPGQKVEPLSADELAALYGVSRARFNEPDYGLGLLGAITGLSGIALIYAAGTTVGAAVLSTVGLATAAFPGTTIALILEIPAIPPALSAAGGAFAGALIGAAVVALVLEFTGAGAGLPPALVYSLIAGGAFTGGVAGYSSIPGFTASSGFVSAAWIVGIVVIAALIYFYFAGIGDTRKRTVEFSCLPWQPPVGGGNCNVCNEGDLPCTKYKCQSLGQTCELVNEGSAEEACVNVSPNDASAPVISPNQEAKSENAEYTDIAGNGFVIANSLKSDGCFGEYEPVSFGVSLNEPGQCKIEEVHTSSYGEMSTLFGESNLFRVSHEQTIAVPSLASLGVAGINPNRRGNFDLFVRCQDASGNANVQEYNIKACVRPADDLTPPIISDFIPENPGYAGSEVLEKHLQFFTNEPADCRWSLIDEDYFSMENEIICNNEINDVTSVGWSCSVNLPVTDLEEQDYYIRCLDKSYVLDDSDDSNDNDRNANSQSAVYKILRTTEALVVEIVSPEQGEVIVAGGEPVSVELEVRTSGGVDGSAQCGFNFDPDSENFIGFFETGGTTHRQTFSTLFEGDYDLTLQCTDIAENVASGSLGFTIDVDDRGPTITRVYNQGGSLTVITNEASECRYDINSCGFDFESEEAVAMSGSDLVHKTSFDAGVFYHVKCEDGFGNVGGCLRVSGGY